jgi:hypothetical protein
MMDFDILGKEVTVVLQKMTKLDMHCHSPSGEDRPTMKEVAECLQILRRLHMHATSAHRDSYYTQNHEGLSSLAVPLDSMTYRSMETSRLVWE